jgi:lysophospholipase L1-like esterase
MLAGSSGGVTLDNLVVVGDSLSAGFQNFSLLDTQQPNGYANLIAKQAGVPLNLPLISSPGIPAVLTIEGTIEGFPLIVPSSTGVGARENPTVQATDLAVPGFLIGDILNTVPHGPPFSPASPIDYLAFSVLGQPGLFVPPPAGPIAKSEVEWAEALKPSFVILWGGNNDALAAVMAGTDTVLTPLSSFESSFSQTIGRLAATHATVVVANIPDVTNLPYLVPVSVLPPNILYPANATYATLDGLSAAFAYLAANPASTYTLGNGQTLTATEIANIQSAVNQYNEIILKYALRNHATLVDTNLLVKVLSVFGYYVNGKHLTTQFLGGLFSLDGVHPTNTGYAILANTFIAVIDLSYGKHIPLVDVSAVNAADPLMQYYVPPSAKLPAAVLRQDASQLLKNMLVR